jgi:hypothetical protein
MTMTNLSDLCEQRCRIRLQALLTSHIEGPLLALPINMIITGAAGEAYVPPPQGRPPVPPMAGFLLKFAFALWGRKERCKHARR